MESKSTELPSEVCRICRKRITHKATGRFRTTCSNACKQKLYRERKGQVGWTVRRKKKQVAKRRALPMTERTFSKAPQSVVKLGEKRGLYECYVCGKPYLVERIQGNLWISPYCSDACRLKAIGAWKRFAMARTLASMRGKLDPRVSERLDGATKMSPLCVHCGTPFAPNTDEDGNRKVGRPRKYCSDKCCKDAYELRWVTAKRRARVHRYHECVECGKRFDRSDEWGRRIKRFCSEKCALRFLGRAYLARQRAKRTGEKVVNGQRIAAKKAWKKTGKMGISNELEQISSGGQKSPKRRTPWSEAVAKANRKRGKETKDDEGDKGFGWGIA